MIGIHPHIGRHSRQTHPRLKSLSNSLFALFRELLSLKLTSKGGDER